MHGMLEYTSHYILMIYTAHTICMCGVTAPAEVAHRVGDRVLADGIRFLANGIRFLRLLQPGFDRSNQLPDQFIRNRFFGLNTCTHMHCAHKSSAHSHYTRTCSLLSLPLSGET